MSFEIEEVVGRKMAGQCLRKNGYYERRYAVERAKMTQKERGGRCKVYKCPYCNLWHVTSKKHEDSGWEGL